MSGPIPATPKIAKAFCIICWRIVARTQVRQSRFTVVVLTCVPERVRVRFVRRFLHTKRVVRIILHNSPAAIQHLYHVAGPLYA